MCSFFAILQCWQTKGLHAFALIGDPWLNIHPPPFKSILVSGEGQWDIQNHRQVWRLQLSAGRANQSYVQFKCPHSLGIELQQSNLLGSNEQNISQGGRDLDEPSSNFQFITSEHYIWRLTCISERYSHKSWRCKYGLSDLGWWCVLVVVPAVSSRCRCTKMVHPMPCHVRRSHLAMTATQWRVVQLGFAEGFCTSKVSTLTW